MQRPHGSWCTAASCATPATRKTISEEAYYSGVGILQCDGCAVDHLIKDNLGLFTGSRWR
ncbi:GM22572 [Drosophila sechellia]|uniref:GM22572 n=1 Tax=Drosophila sechellia TaxID=7238 RepID=B4IKB7_DROSE|nr:GM22572 [Drosophila sechellia]